MTVLNDLLLALAALVTATTGLLGVLLVQVRKIKLEAERQAARTTASLAALHGTSDATLEQVGNAHATNLRDDLDRIADTVCRIDTRTERLGTELHDERLARERLGDDAHDTHKEIYERLRKLETP